MSFKFKILNASVVVITELAVITGCTGPVPAVCPSVPATVETVSPSEASTDTESVTQEPATGTSQDTDTATAGSGHSYSCAADADGNLSINVDGTDFSVPAFSQDSPTPYIGISYQSANVSFAASYEYYSELDGLGRCGYCEACIGTDIQPTEERGEIGNVRPSGWDYDGHSNNNKYPELIADKYIYNRCHLIGYQLTGENDNVCNLVTGTRYMNIDGMLWLEDEADDYLEQNPSSHVYYLVIPVFMDDELVCRGLVMNVVSEDASINESIFVYNAQPGIEINYLTGENQVYTGQTPAVETSAVQTAAQETVVLNTSSQKIHNPSCDSVSDIKAQNRQEYTGDIQTLYDQGYTDCKKCRK